LQAQAFQSGTFDHDMLFTKHHVLDKKLKLQTWFCDAYTSWQKGGVNNTNGRIRRSLPRHPIAMLSAITTQRILSSQWTQRRKNAWNSKHHSKPSWGNLEQTWNYTSN